MDSSDSVKCAWCSASFSGQFRGKSLKRHQRKQHAVQLQVCHVKEKHFPKQLMSASPIPSTSSAMDESSTYDDEPISTTLTIERNSLPILSTAFISEVLESTSSKNNSENFNLSDTGVGIPDSPSFSSDPALMGDVFDFLVSESVSEVLDPSIFNLIEEELPKNSVMCHVENNVAFKVVRLAALFYDLNKFLKHCQALFPDTESPFFISVFQALHPHREVEVVRPFNLTPAVPEGGIDVIVIPDNPQPSPPVYEMISDDD